MPTLLIPQIRFHDAEQAAADRADGVDFLSRRHLLDQSCRFDVVTVDFAAGRPRIEVYPHVFTA